MEAERSSFQARPIVTGTIQQSSDDRVELHFEKSQKRIEAARKLAPGGVHSNVRLNEVPWPLSFQSADGVRLTDVDGNVLLDFALGQGPLLLGHRPPEVIQAVERQLHLGLLYAGQHDLELEVAGLVAAMVPCAERLRFGVTGSESVQLAIRLARAATGRAKVLKFQGHYHGWADTVLFNVGTTGASRDGLIDVIAESTGLAPSSRKDVLVTQWNDGTVLERVLSDHGSEIAAVIMEPVMANTGGVIPPRQGYLEATRRLCDRFGAVLIFDEVITGFRLGPGGAQARLGVTPDLAVFGKAIASGFPLSCVAGRASLLDGVENLGVNHSGTFNGSPISLAAAAATLTLLSDPSQGIYERLNQVGTRLLQGLRSVAMGSPVPLVVQGFPELLATMFANLPVIQGYADAEHANSDALHQFLQSLVAKGVRPTSRGTWMLSSAHSESDVDVALDATERSLQELA
jgi:glutamate-1-semialdehyde 2,1-aminomutase